MLIKSYTKFTIFIFLFFLSVGSNAQKLTPKKYPSVFWEITGNGIKKPSYLFGTMHVSSKQVFHLSDSFYLALKSVDAVALELNPDLWQPQMATLEETKKNYARYIETSGADYLNENSFRINKYDDQLKAALSTEPTVVNSLLYRTYKVQEDFEEDTFLDMYIFQTGKKFGKRSAGVEDFYETEKIVLEAYSDMAKEKVKKTIDTDGETMNEIQEKMQDAYRRGDLDLMDSLDLLVDQSPAFREKFLYKRNEIQANSIDTIIRKEALFVGVGAAHLPGVRGVIELLRKKGYTLRPIRMADRNAAKKDEIDQLKVPVVFSRIQSDDGLYSVEMPGKLYKQTDENQLLDRQQYSDMSNGSYYIVTRVKTYGSFSDKSERQVFSKIDSLLYENIPGKILKKTIIHKNGYNGFDITNKTRRGDIQRYNIFITPFEVLFFKMSGKTNYVAGKEAEQFFSSIQLKEADNIPIQFSPAQGGFSIRLPQKPTEHLNKDCSDGINRWEYKANDNLTGETYLVFKKTINNFNFIEEDTFLLKLVEESFRSPDFFERQLTRSIGTLNGAHFLQVKEKLKDSSWVLARHIIRGNQCYSIAVHTNQEGKDYNDFFNSFKFTQYKYGTNEPYKDSFLLFAVHTPVLPKINNTYRAMVETISEDVINNSSTYANVKPYWPNAKKATITNDSTGESVFISIQQYPRYYYVTDSNQFWKNLLDDYYDHNDLVLAKKDYFITPNGARGWRFSLKDTGSSSVINRMLLLKDDYMYSVANIADSVQPPSSFIRSFYSTFLPQNNPAGRNIFVNNLDTFFRDLFSKDSTTHGQALLAQSNVFYGESGIPKITEALNRISASDKDYFNIKTKFIAELGYIRDTTKPLVVALLKKIYQQSSDTGIFQNEVITALARHKTSAAINLFKELILQDPPIFEDEEDYAAIFNSLYDSLKLVETLYPDILQLTVLQDYKEPVTSLLVRLVDSGLISSKQYENYFSKIYFDAKIELKKQRSKDEKKMKEVSKGDETNEPERNYINADDKTDFDDYAVLLMPFYLTNKSVEKYFEKLLTSKDEQVQLNTAVALLKNNHPVPDSTLLQMASRDQLRCALYAKLEKVNRLDRFPLKYKTQMDIARSYLVADNGYDKMDSIIFIKKQSAQYNNKKGVVYFFKYRVKKEDDWKIGLSGLQPLEPGLIATDNKLSSMTNKKLRDDKPIDNQFQDQLKKLLYTFHKSARNYFESESNSYRFMNGYGVR